MVELVGRDVELAAVDGMLARASDGLAVLRIVGEPGIGKSALIGSAIERARAAGIRVLRCQPVAAEARLAFSALADLLEPIVDPAIERLPAPQRLALEVALLRRSADGRRITPRAVSAATLAILRDAADATPLLIAIDDEPWLDRASAGAMAYAVRRLVDAPAALLLARRDQAHEPTPLDDLDALGPDHVRTLRIAPLSLSATFHVLRAHGLAPPSRPALRRIHEAARGNPLYALELARAADPAPAPGADPDPRGPLPMTDSVRTLFGRRLAAHGPSAQPVLLAVALAGTPTEPLIRGVVDDPAPIDDLVAAGILDRQEGRLTFAHPLLAEAAVAAADDEARRAMHGRLAAVTSAPERRARHRALATPTPDRRVADELDAAAMAAASTSPDAAYELLELAIAATPSDDIERRDARSLALARQAVRAGDTTGAIAILDELIATRGVGVTRARALEARATIDWVAGGLDDAIDRCDEGLAMPGLDPWTIARLAVTRARLAMDPTDGLERATVALAALDRLPTPDPALRGEALTALGAAQAALGDAVDPAVVEEALELESIAPPAAVADRFSAALGAWLKYQGRFAEARIWLRRTLDTAMAEGDEGSLPYALSHLPQLELWTGDWPAAEAAAREHLVVAEWTGQAEQRLTAIYSLALVEAHAGRTDDARRRIAAALPEAERHDPWNVYQLTSVLGFIELSEGDPAAAVPPLRRAHEIYEGLGAGDTAAVHENLAEALVESGHLTEAGPLIEAYVERATRLKRPMGLAASHRARALWLGAEGRSDEALEAIASALRHEDAAAVPFSRGRTLLVAGRLRRRAGERRASRLALEGALEAFDGLGARPWSARARRELDRLPGARPGDPATLTQAERRIAELVGQGLTNREVAQRLFVTPKTVETTLTRVYGKLAVRSRTELAARLRDAGVPGPGM